MIKLYLFIGLFIGFPAAVALYCTITITGLKKSFSSKFWPQLFLLSRLIFAGMFVALILVIFTIFMVLGWLKLTGERQGVVVLSWKVGFAYDMFVILSCVWVYYLFSDDIVFIICLLIFLNNILPYGVVVFHWVGLGLLDLFGSACFVITWHFAQDCSMPLKVCLLLLSIIISFQKRLPTPTYEEIEMKMAEEREAARKEAKEREAARRKEAGEREAARRKEAEEREAARRKMAGEREAARRKEAEERVAARRKEGKNMVDTGKNCSGEDATKKTADKNESEGDASKKLIEEDEERARKMAEVQEALRKISEEQEALRKLTEEQEALRELAEEQEALRKLAEEQEAARRAEDKNMADNGANTDKDESEKDAVEKTADNGANESKEDGAKKVTDDDADEDANNSGNGADP